MSNHDPARHPSMPETGLAIVRSMKLCVAMFIGATAFSASGVAMHRLFDPRDRGVYRIIAGAQFGTEGRIPLAGGRSYLVESGLLTLCLIGIAIPVALILGMTAGKLRQLRTRTAVRLAVGAFVGCVVGGLGYGVFLAVYSAAPRANQLAVGALGAFLIGGYAGAIPGCFVGVIGAAFVPTIEVSFLRGSIVMGAVCAVLGAIGGLIA